MEIELVPDPGAADHAAQAAAIALSGEGLADDERPPGVAGAWRRAGVEEAVNRAAANDAAHSATSVPRAAFPSRAAPPPTRSSSSGSDG